LFLGLKDNIKDIRMLRVMLKYGVREELLPLVKLKSIGRVRARKLYNAGFKTVSSLRKAPQKTLARIIGPQISYGIKEQLGEKATIPYKELKKKKTSKQSNLEKF